VTLEFLEAFALVIKNLIVDDRSPMDVRGVLPHHGRGVRLVVLAVHHDVSRHHFVMSLER
jgi:hypothetical protein